MFVNLMADCSHTKTASFYYNDHQNCFRMIVHLARQNIVKADPFRAPLTALSVSNTECNSLPREKDRYLVSYVVC